MESLASVSTDLVRLLLEYAATQGLRAGVLLAGAGLDRSTLEDREARVPFARYQALWLAAAEQSADPDFGLHFGEAARHFPAGHLLGAVMLNSPTVGEALTRFCRLHGLLGDAVAPRLDRGVAPARLVVEPTDPALTLTRHYDEANLTVLLTFTRRLCADQVRPVAAWFAHEPPTDRAELARVFGCPLHFGQRRNELHLDPGLLDTPLRHADPDLLEMVERLAEERLARSTTPPGWTQRAERSILRTLLTGESKPTVEAVARELAVSVRHLQGRLKDEDITYQQVLDRVRRELAEDYLRRDDLSLCEVAFLLGYGEQSAFNHAFKRWTGQTPRQFRGDRP
jgi:AraC-like DNA-binding protein